MVYEAVDWQVSLWQKLPLLQFLFFFFCSKQMNSVNLYYINRFICCFFIPIKMGIKLMI